MQMMRLDIRAFTPSLIAAEVIAANKRKRVTNQSAINISLWSWEGKGRKMESESEFKKYKENGKQRV